MRADTDRYLIYRDGTMGQDFSSKDNSAEGILGKDAGIRT